MQSVSWCAQNIEEEKRFVVDVANGNLRDRCWRVSLSISHGDNFLVLAGICMNDKQTIIY
jgi:hypothetical protein